MHNYDTIGNYTVEDVADGLRQGKSYVRSFGMMHFGGYEIVKAVPGNRSFTHVYVGPDHGGMVELDIEIILNGKWPKGGWELILP